MRKGEKMSPEQLAAHRKQQAAKKIADRHRRLVDFRHYAEEIKSIIDCEISERENVVKQAISEYILHNPETVEELPSNVELEDCKDSDMLVLGGWECEKSPTGCCVYHDIDPMHDECLFCGDPEERK